ncbi:MAG: GNVR domain-containing protein, partial [Terriglobia bacterium]
MATLNERLGLLGKAINEYRTTGMTVPNLAAGPEQRTSDPLFTRLKELERSLVALTAEYKDTYPDVIQVKQEIERVKAQLAERQELMQQDKAKAIGAETTSARKGFDPYLDGLVKQRDEIGLEIRTLKERHRRVMVQMKEYEERVEQAPAREQELMLLVRDYDSMQKNYQSLLDKRVNARVAENLEKRQKGEQFRVLDSANLPGTPEKPDRLRIMLLGLMLGCGVGYGGAFALEFLNPSFRRPEDAEEALGFPVLAAIPDFRLAYGKGMEGTSAGTSESRQRTRGRLLPLKDKLGNGKSRKPRMAGRNFPSELTLVTKWSPLSVVAEQFRVAATRL